MPAGAGTSSVSTPIDDVQRGVGESNLAQKKNLSWRRPGDTSVPGRDASLADGAPPTVDVITGADPGAPDTRKRYVDEFLHAIYDIDDSDGSGYLSKRLTVVYTDGTRIRINLDEIGDELYARLHRDEHFFYIGRGKRTFPRVLNRGTAPNLWVVKQQALIVIEEFNADNFLIMNMTMVAISFVFPPPTAGLPWGIQGRGGLFPRAANDKLDAVLARVQRRLGQTNVPEEKPAPLRAPPRLQPRPRGPYATLPNGKRIPPDHRGTVYHGTHEFTPQDVVRAGGIPEKTGALDRGLYEHTLDGANSDFRGVTPFLRAPQGGLNQGAAEWAVRHADVGYVYKIEGAPVYELGQHLEGRIPEPLVGYRSSRPGTSAEVESVTHSRVPIDNIKEVFRVTRVDERIQIERLDWGRIKATTRTVPSSL